MVIKEVNKKSTEGNLSTNTITSADKLFLFAHREIDNIAEPGFADEGEQYEYWRIVKNGTLDAHRVKKLSNGAGNAYLWYLRSPALNLTNAYRVINTTGAASLGMTATAGVPIGVCFGFCV